MGLLDDAIRDHLELKRRRGADPGEVAREQREALDDAYASPPEGTDELAEGGPLEAEQPSAVSAVLGEDDAVGGETAELDMSTVLADDHDDAPPAAVEEDSLEWEMPEPGRSRLDDPPTASAVD